MAWTTPRTWVSGETLTAALLNTHLRDQFKTIGDPWTSYTVTWTGSTTNPAIGNGALIGNYIALGKLVIFSIRVQWGSTTTNGSGSYLFSLPVTSLGTNYPISCTARLPGNATRAGSLQSATELGLFNEAGTQVGSGTTAWTTGNVIAINGLYQSA